MRARKNTCKLEGSTTDFATDYYAFSAELQSRHPCARRSVDRVPLQLAVGGRVLEALSHSSKRASMTTDLIFDLGMNTGEDTDFYLKKGFRVLAIEANPLLVDAARQAFADSVRQERLRLLNVAIGPQRGRVPFYVNETYHEWSSIVKELGARGGKFHEVEVEAVVFDQIFADHGVPYYLKIDIEGMDGTALGAVERLTERPPLISVETGASPWWIDKLHELDYQRFKLVEQMTVPQLKCPEPAREGQSIEHAFKLGSSGPFGDDTPGEWLTWQETREQWLAIINEAKPDRPLWFDVHARLS